MCIHINLCICIYLDGDGVVTLNEFISFTGIYMNICVVCMYVYVCMYTHLYIHISMYLYTFMYIHSMLMVMEWLH
jgi:hypothetical protein